MDISLHGCTTSTAGRTYAVAAITGTATNISEDSHNQIPALCHMGAEIPGEMVKHEDEQADTENE